MLIPARHVRKGLTIVDLRRGNYRRPVLRVTTCQDGSIRIVTDGDDQRMTASVLVRVAR